MIGLSAVTDIASLHPESVQAQLAISLTAVVVSLALIYGIHRINRWLGERMNRLLVDVITGTLFISVVVLASVVLLATWDQLEYVQQLLTEIELGAEIFAKLFLTLAVVTGTYVLLRLIRRVLNEILASASAVTDHQREITHRIVQVTVWGTALIVILGVWIDDLGGLLIGAGFLGIVLGMAARQTLGTILAGFVLMFARPFEIGDWIEVDGNEGIVTDISIVDTRIQTFDGEFVVIPNNLVGASMVTNRTKRGILRIEVDVGVDYESDISEAMSIARECANSVDISLQSPAPQVVLKEFGSSSIVIGVRCWIDKPSARRRWETRTALIRSIVTAFDEADIKIPFPQRELMGRSESGGLQIAGEPQSIDAELDLPDGSGGFDETEPSRSVGEDN